MPGGDRITLKDIARAAGLSKSAVSMALRNHPDLAPATRERVCRLAEEMGYRPDPALSALSSYRHGKRGVAGGETLAWVTNWRTSEEWRRTSPVYRGYFVGACRRAERLGYRLEHFWMGEPGMTRERFEQILHSRGIRGLLLAPLPLPPVPFDLTWSRYAAVTIGTSISRPPLHRVTFSPYGSTNLVLESLRRRGYRRIGCVLPVEANERTEHAWLAAFLLFQFRHAEDYAVPPLLLQPDENRRSRFCGWLDAHRPDAVVTVGARFPMMVREWCLGNGIRVPDDCGIAVISNVPLDGDLSGIHEPSEDMGETAVDVLTGMLYRNDLGPPRLPRRTLLEGTWVEGGTVRALDRRSERDTATGPAGVRSEHQSEWLG
jgi:LacI family transcriptional regulator